MRYGRKIRFQVAGIVLLALISGVISYPKIVVFIDPVYQKVNQLKVSLGLDLQGGVHLEYVADVNSVPEDQREDAINSAQAVIERRVNAFGVGEPLIQTSRSGEERRIIVELPGVKDIEDAKKLIKETPTLEFREERADDDPDLVQTLTMVNGMSLENAKKGLERALAGEDFAQLASELSQDPGSKEDGGNLDFQKKGAFVPEFDIILFDENNPVGIVHPNIVESSFGYHIIKIEERRGEGEEREVRSRHILFAKMQKNMVPELQYKETGLTGRYLESASIDFGNQYAMGDPRIVLHFDEEGSKLFKEITERNLGKTLAIFIDKEKVTAPTVQSIIPDGVAEITGQYTLEEAQSLKSRLNEGALPVPLQLVGQQSIEASLGQEDLNKSLKAGFFGVLAVIIYMVVYYRFFGVIAGVALIMYTTMLIAIFKLSSFPGWDWPITLTLSGIAGFILSIGMAVDANVLIFERIKEELRNGKYIESAIREGFRRAWPSIRDGNLSTLLTCVILIWMGTGFVQGFALILFLGVSFSMFTAIGIVQTMVKALPMQFLDRHLWLIARIKRSKNKK
ncbi:MAG: protein translocase subunit SecD [Candidatus Moraniibacteriota bacterium]|nr:MAG: protein translocase subunit SecD [Candidatus Moranbacteria bacterium]